MVTRAFKVRLDYNWGRTWQHHGSDRFKFTMDIYQWLRWFRVIPGHKTMVHLDGWLLHTRTHAITRLIPRALRLPAVLCICHSLPRTMRSPWAPVSPPGTLPLALLGEPLSRSDPGCDWARTTWQRFVRACIITFTVNSQFARIHGPIWRIILRKYGGDSNL